MNFNGSLSHLVNTNNLLLVGWLLKEKHIKQPSFVHSFVDRQWTRFESDPTADGGGERPEHLIWELLAIGPVDGHLPVWRKKTGEDC